MDLKGFPDDLAEMIEIVRDRQAPGRTVTEAVVWYVQEQMMGPSRGNLMRLGPAPFEENRRKAA